MATDIEHEYLHQRRFDVRLHVRMNRLYQQQRQSAMEAREGAVKVASLLAGSVALARVADPWAVQIAAAVIFAGTAASLVFGWGNKARDAARRSSDWTSLERDINAAGERTFTEDQLDEWAARCVEIEAAEPTQNARMLDAAYLKAAEGLGVEPPASSYRRWVPAMLVP